MFMTVQHKTWCYLVFLYGACCVVLAAPSKERPRKGLLCRWYMLTGAAHTPCARMGHTMCNEWAAVLWVHAARW